MIKIKIIWEGRSGHIEIIKLRHFLLKCLSQAYKVKSHVHDICVKGEWIIPPFLRFFDWVYQQCGMFYFSLYYYNINNRNLLIVMKAGGLAPYNPIQPTISLEMPVPSKGHCGFPSFQVVDWFCLFVYLWILPFLLEDC